MHAVTVRLLGTADYQSTWQAMRAFTNSRNANTEDEIWLLQHPPVFTQGQAGKAEHLLATGDIPVIQVDRGGQVTYHGPGQLVGYLLVDIERKHMGARQLVSAIEKAIVATLGTLTIKAAPRADAPGVYTQDKKIASLGLRIRNGRSFHGLALNIDMDMSPFLRINPCGYADMQMAQVSDFIEHPDFAQIQQQLLTQLIDKLSYTQHIITQEPWTPANG
ncbi:MAG: octanoyltransferase [Gammaproteobacteria bacterium]|nr:MAG: octanoyltransferase [Gammaproteobacteria bacterium]